MKRITALLLAVTLFFSGAGEILAAEGSKTNSNINVGTDTEILLSENPDYGLKMENKEGTCGAEGNEANVTWAIYDSNTDGDDTANTGDTLVLSGSGAMASYDGSWLVPWSSYKGDITTVIFEENSNITNIGDNAFYYFRSLNNITIPDSVTSIGNYAFCGCSALSSIKIPNGTTSIGEYAFWNCESLTSIFIPESVQTIGGSAFQGCNQQLEIHVADTNNYFCVEDGILYNKDKTALILGTAASGDFVIPDSVTKISASAFYNCTGLTGITIPDGVTCIDDYTFYECTNLKNVLFSKNLTSINEYAFTSCEGLESIVIPDGVTSIEMYAFAYCNSLKNITLSKNLKTINHQGFSCCPVTSITLPEGFTTIGSAAFSSCEELVNISIPQSVNCIGQSAFDGCTKLTEITIPDKVTEIGSMTFYGCSDLTSVTLSKNITSVGSQAFEECDSLTSITIPDGVTSITDSAFYGCENLISVVMPKKLETIERFAFYHCDNLEEITIPAGVTGIGESAFGCCEKIKNIKLPQGITSIKEKTFWYCDGLESLIIPENVTQIQSNALQYCTGMKDLYYLAGLDISSSGITSSTLQASYVINDDGTVSITVTNIPEGTTDITLPEEISERQISSLSFAEGLDGTGISIQCTKHFPNTGEWEKDAEEHWFTECKVCGETGEFKEAHEFSKGTQACRCGYVPFTITTQPESKDMVYGEQTLLSVTVNPAYEELRIIYQWYENGEKIEYAEAGTYLTEPGKAVSDYTYFCKISCGEYSIESNEAVISIAKADSPSVTPDARISVQNTVKKVSAVTLPIDWEWDSEDADKTLPAGEDLEVTANYIGEDKEFYNNISVKVVIRRAECISGEILYTGEGEQAPTCISEGKGHKECTICRDILETNITVPLLEHEITKIEEEEAGCTTEGRKAHWKCTECKKLFSDEEGIHEAEESRLIIPANGHTGGTADCTHKAVCTICQEAYGEFDSGRHGETEVRNAKEADCVDEGYTGDTYCKDCGKKISEGKSIEKTAHIWDGGVITKEPTTTENGMKTYTCTECQTTRTEEIDKLSSEEPEIPAVVVTSITLNKTKANIGVGKTLKLKATINPSNATNKKVTWSTSNKKVATVDKTGKVTGKKAGTATITVTTANGKKATCKVTVVKATLNASGFALQVKKSTTALKVTSTLKGDKVKSWKSSNTKIVTVNKKGKVTAKSKTGKATITVTMKSGATAKCTVTVQKGKVTTKKLTLDKNRVTLKVGKKITLKVARNPISATEKITWTTSNKKIATVDKNGKVTAKKAGTVTITAKTSNGKKVTCKITVKKK